MARRIVWTEAALDDIDESASYIARDSPRYAKAFVRRIKEAGRSLNRFPERGRMVPEFEEPDIRELIVGSHRLIYRLTPARVEVLGVIHGARDLPALWKRENRDG